MLPPEVVIPAQGSNSLTVGALITQLELEQYRIALVSPQSSEADTGRNPHRDRTARLLMLPLTWRELITRVRIEIGHSTSSNERSVFQFGRVHVELLSMEVRRAERPVNLTAMEFKVLRFFVMNPNRVISRDVLLDEVWGYHNYPCTRTVDNHVLRLRQKLELDPPHPVHFRTVHGIGYKFVP
jgi:DNA-binding response OmpR family regulator